MDITAALAFGLSARTTPRLTARELVDGGVYVAGSKLFPGFYFFAALPPISITSVEDILLGRFGRGLLLGLFVGNLRFYVTGFFF